MHPHALVFLLTLIAATTASGADAWKPAAGPLQTRWTAQVSPTNALPDYPRPQMTRDAWQNLNGLWQYAIEPNAAASAADRPPAWQGQILVPFPVESQLSGVMRAVQPTDRVWYRRSFTVPADWAGRRILLHFGAVDWQSVVWLNGRQLGVHTGGYDAFTYDVTPYLAPGGAQELTLAVVDPTNAGGQPRGKQNLTPKGCDYTAATGIWQTVWLEPVPTNSIVAVRNVPNIDRGAVDVTVETTDPATVNATALYQGRVIGRASGRSGEALTISVPEAKLWSPDHPNLYELRVSLQRDGQIVDRVGSYFGMRKISLGHDAKGVTRIFLNNKEFFPVGPLDQGFWPDGVYTAPTDEALAYDIKATKQVGMNFCRKHVKVEPERWYYWCDKLGLAVWQDMPFATNNNTPEYHADFENELFHMVVGRRNHPCIIQWVIFNEATGQHDTERYVNLVREWDGSRLVDNASGYNDAKCGDVIDIHPYPDPACPPLEANRAAVAGEFGGLGLSVPGHQWNGKGWGYREEATSAALTRAFCEMWAKVWELRRDAGLAAAVYTQTTDCETEQNGFLTYDRAVFKVDPAQARRAIRGEMKVLAQGAILAPTSETAAQSWRYTTAAPGSAWANVGFDDSAWSVGAGGFGSAGTPGGQVRTSWTTSDLWLRRTATLPASRLGEVGLRMHHDEDVDVYLNGVFAAHADGFTTGYHLFAISAAAAKTLKPGGPVVIAAHCRQTTGGQFLDVGLVALR